MAEDAEEEAVEEEEKKEDLFDVFKSSAKKGFADLLKRGRKSTVGGSFSQQKKSAQKPETSPLQKISSKMQASASRQNRHSALISAENSAESLSSSSV